MTSAHVHRLVTNLPVSPSRSPSWLAMHAVASLDECKGVTKKRLLVFYDMRDTEEQDAGSTLAADLRGPNDGVHFTSRSGALRAHRRRSERAHPLAPIARPKRFALAVCAAGRERSVLVRSPQSTRSVPPPCSELMSDSSARRARPNRDGHEEPPMNCGVERMTRPSRRMQPWAPMQCNSAGGIPHRQITCCRAPCRCTRKTDWRGTSRSRTPRASRCIRARSSPRRPSASFASSEHRSSC
jgi:hypothetical protein